MFKFFLKKTVIHCKYLRQKYLIHESVSFHLLYDNVGLDICSVLEVFLKKYLKRTFSQ